MTKRRTPSRPPKTPALVPIGAALVNAFACGPQPKPPQAWSDPPVLPPQPMPAEIDAAVEPPDAPMAGNPPQAMPPQVAPVEPADDPPQAKPPQVAKPPQAKPPQAKPPQVRRVPPRAPVLPPRPIPVPDTAPVLPSDDNRRSIEPSLVEPFDRK